MSRLGLSLCVLSLLAAVGCTRRAADPGECESLGPAACAQNPRCEVHPACCGGTICAPAGSHYAPCPYSCVATCTGLDESHCKANPSCRADYCDQCQCTPSFTGCSDANSAPPTCEALPCPALFCSCDGLDEQTCKIAAGQGAGCTVETCPDCKGGSYFVGCGGPNEGVWACPDHCPASDCHGNQDCSGAICLPPGAKQCPGVCTVGTACTSDTDCTSGQVCDTAPCLCAPGGRVCQPACKSNSDCSEGLGCSLGHCAPLACASAGGCPKNFDCVFPPGSGASPSCHRRACTGESDCPGGTCVDGGCYAMAGTCAPPPPP